MALRTQIFFGLANYIRMAQQSTTGNPVAANDARSAICFCKAGASGRLYTLTIRITLEGWDGSARCLIMARSLRLTMIAEKYKSFLVLPI